MRAGGTINCESTWLGLKLLTAVADLEGASGSKPPLRSPEDLMEDVLKLKFLEGSATPLFVVEVLVFQVIEGNCVRLGVLLLAKLNLLCLEMSIKSFFFIWSSTKATASHTLVSGHNKVDKRMRAGG